MDTPTGAAAPEDSTLVQQIDELVADVLAAAKKPTLTTILVVVQQIVGFIVFFGIISNTQEGELMAIINGAVGLGVMLFHAYQVNSAHKVVSGVTQAKLDLLASGWPRQPEPDQLVGRVGGVRG